MKIRGFRIEPGEVEAAVARHPAVRQAAVVAREDAPGEPRLVAYLVAGQPPAPPAGELRRFLKETLPEYMVPSAFVTLESLPLTPNGKLDRRALPPPDPSRPELDQALVLPRTPVEEVLAGIWSEVLGLERVGVHDNFFDLGGHSLRATQVVSRVRRALAVEVPLRALFEHPTVAALARRVEADRVRAAAPPPPPLVCTPRTADPPLSFAQQRLWFLDRLEPGSSTYNIAAAVRLRGSLDEDALERSLHEVVRRHEVLRTTFPMHGGRPVQAIAAAGAPPAPRRVDLSGMPADRSESEAWALAAAEARQPFELERGPLLRATLVRTGPDERLVLLTVHHIVADGWSMGVLVHELGALYGAYRGGLPSPLPDLPVQYADYAAWQQQWLSGPVLEGLLAYWRERLSGLAPLQLPADRPRPLVPSSRGAHLAFLLSPAVTDSLRALSRREEVTLFMTLLAAFQALLHRYTGQDDIAVGSPIAGRDRAEIEGLIGFFVNTLVLRTDSRATRPSASSCTGCARSRWGPTPTRTCRSSNWSTPCSPSGTGAALRSSRCCSRSKAIGTSRSTRS